MQVSLQNFLEIFVCLIVMEYFGKVLIVVEGWSFNFYEVYGNEGNNLNQVYNRGLEMCDSYGDFTGSWIRKFRLEGESYYEWG